MLTRVVIVEPVYSFTIGEDSPACQDRACCGKAAAPAAGYQAGSKAEVMSTFWSLLTTAVQKAGTQLPLVLDEVLAVIESALGFSAGPYGANGAILAALAAFLQKAATALPTLLPEILQIIALFGGTVTPPAPSPTAPTT